MKIPKIGVSEFNQNISEYLNRAIEGEIIYVTKRNHTSVVLIGKEYFDLLIGELNGQKKQS